mgnify:CR=1 FL=1
MTELNPCPFCGSEELFIDPGEYRADYMIMCVDCGGRIGYFPSKAQAIAAWNRRANND